MQIECICAEKTDESIRQALKDLPKDLSAGFVRILQKAKQKGRCYQKDILKIVVGAYRPLQAAELRDALSVAPGDASWYPEKMINNIYTTLQCCGCLVVVDEEELTVRLIHQSVAQFLLEKTEESEGLHFTSGQAEDHLGQVTVTYLNYGTFEQRLSTNVVPKIHVGYTPDRIIESTLQSYGALGQIVTSLLQSKSQVDREVSRTLAISGAFSRKQQLEETFPLFQYASENWLHHTRAISSQSSVYTLWLKLLENPRFNDLPWVPDEIPPDDIIVDASRLIWRLAPRAIWAIYHSHLQLFSVELHSSRGLKAFCNVMPYLTALVDSSSLPNLSTLMSDRLLQILTLYRASSVVENLIQLKGFTFDQYWKFVWDMGLYDYTTARWLMSLSCFAKLDDSEQALVEISCENNNLHTVRSITMRGARVDIYQTAHPLVTLYQLGFHKPHVMAITRCLLCCRSGANVSVLSRDRLYKCLFWFSQSVNLQFFDPFETIAKLHSPQDRVKTVYRSFLTKVCRRGDYTMAQKLLPYVKPHEAPDFIQSLLPETLFARSPTRTRLVKLLLGIKQPLMGGLDRSIIRCVELRDWSSATRLANVLGYTRDISRRSDDPLFRSSCSGYPHFRSFIQSQELLEFCVDARDMDGITFVLDTVDLDIFRGYLDAIPIAHDRAFSNTTLLSLALPEPNPTSLHEFCEIVQTLNHILEKGLRSPSASFAISPTLHHAALELGLTLCDRILKRFILTAQLPCDPYQINEDSFRIFQIYATDFTTKIGLKIDALKLLEDLLNHL